MAKHQMYCKRGQASFLTCVLHLQQHSAGKYGKLYTA